MLEGGALFTCLSPEDRRVAPWEFLGEAQPIDCALPDLGPAMFRAPSELVMRSMSGVVQVLPRSCVLWRWENHQQVLAASKAFGVPLLPGPEGLVRGRRWRIDDAAWTRVARALRLTNQELARQLGLRPRGWLAPSRTWHLDESQMVRAGRLLERPADHPTESARP